jgi:hypothetical protein
VATYADIQREVKASAGFVPKTCWIAHVLELLGIKLRTAPNRINFHGRKYPCPPEKRLAITAALYRLGRLQATPAGSLKGIL